MRKSVIILLCFFSVLSCKPVDKQIAQHKGYGDFSCLKTQSQCDIQTEFGQFTVGFLGAEEQGMLHTELPFNIQVEFTDHENSHQISAIQSYLEGKTMFMGKVPVFFEMTEKENILQAETLLASCHEEIMTWRLWLTIHLTQNGKVVEQTIFIDFDSKRI